MKLLHITFHFEYSDVIEEILDRNGIEDYVRYPMMEGKDSEGKHYGTQVYPGSTTVLQAQINEDEQDTIMDELGEFKHSKSSHNHLEALVLPVDQKLT